MRGQEDVLKLLMQQDEAEALVLMTFWPDVGKKINDTVEHISCKASDRRSNAVVRPRSRLLQLGSRSALPQCLAFCTGFVIRA